VVDLNGLAAVSSEAEVHLAFTALGDDEVRRWEMNCRGLEDVEAYPWAIPESRALMDSVLACLFGEDLLQLDAPVRAWATTNTTMGIFTRRLGCLRELIAQESLINGPDSFDRLQEVFDRVTVVATQAALESLVYGGDSTTGLDDGGLIESAPEPVTDVSDDTSDEAAESNRRRKVLLVLLGLAVALLIAGLAFALAPSPAHHPTGDTKSGGTVSSNGGSTKSGSPHSNRSPLSNSTTSGSGKVDLPSSGRAAHGSTASSQTGKTGTGDSGVGAVGTGTSNPGSGGGTSGTNPTGNGSGSKDSGTTITLPGGGSLTVPAVTIPGGTQVTTPPVTVPGQQVHVPNGTSPTTPGITIPSL
jgi:hypothetical protein